MTARRPKSIPDAQRSKPGKISTSFFRGFKKNRQSPYPNPRKSPLDAVSGANLHNFSCNPFGVNGDSICAVFYEVKNGQSLAQTELGMLDSIT